MRDYQKEIHQFLGQTPIKPAASRTATVRHTVINQDGSKTTVCENPWLNSPRSKRALLLHGNSLHLPFTHDDSQRRGRPCDPVMLAKLPLLILWPRDDPDADKGRPKRVRVIDYGTAVIMHDLVQVQLACPQERVPEHLCWRIFLRHYANDEARAYAKRIAMRHTQHGYKGFIASDGDEKPIKRITDQTLWWVPNRGLFEIVWHISRIDLPPTAPLTSEEASKLIRG